MGRGGVVGAAAIAAIVAITLTGCDVGTSPVERDPDVSLPTFEEVAPELKQFYTQELRWKDCGLDAQCTAATAPMNWAEPVNGETVSLALVRHRANDGAL